MSLAITCRLFWTDEHAHVVSATNETAVCDSDHTQCLLAPRCGNGQQLRVVCDSRTHFPTADAADDGFRLASYYAQYFCVCDGGGRALAVPPGVTCGSPSCYYDAMDTRFPRCELVFLYDAFTQGENGPGQQQQQQQQYYKETCTAFDCDTVGVNCTNNNGGGDGNGGCCTRATITSTCPRPGPT
ncbi:hypothetical protein PG993_004119 [Apiospora rasikravindrae]|uniref:Uncharacterized protein n=1 Tax=Apiospora rasikravindrae TaxID=990691 RepID=A0ABR1TBW2_9PEZI